MFKITIEETKTVKQAAGNEWSVIGDKEVPRDEGFYRPDPTEPKTRLQNVYGYTPLIEKAVTVTSEVYMQQVEHLNLPRVIAAINEV